MIFKVFYRTICTLEISVLLGCLAVCTSIFLFITKEVVSFLLIN